MTRGRIKLTKPTRNDRQAVVSPIVEVPFSVELREDLEIACLDAMRGDPWGPAMATRLQRTCMDVLRAHGLDGVRVRASSTQAGTRVHIHLPSPDHRVNEVILSIG